MARLSDPGKVSNPSQRYLLDIAKSANDASATVRKAWADYRSPIDYGLTDLGLQARGGDDQRRTARAAVLYVLRQQRLRHHVVQNDLHGRLLTYTSDAISGFMQDMERIGQCRMT